MSVHILMPCLTSISIKTGISLAKLTYVLGRTGTPLARQCRAASTARSIDCGMTTPSGSTW